MRTLCGTTILMAALGCSGAAPVDPSPAPPDPAAAHRAPVERTSSPAATFVPPPYDYDALSDAEHAEVCGHTGEPPSPDVCAADTDCRICHDGSNCGIPANLTTLERRGAECTRADAAECEYAAVRCCDGHCRVVSH